MLDGPYLLTGGGILLCASRSVGVPGAWGGIDHGEGLARGRNAQ